MMNTPTIAFETLGAEYEQIAEDIACSITDMYNEQLGLRDWFGREFSKLVMTVPRFANADTWRRENAEVMQEQSQSLLAEYVNKTSAMQAGHVPGH